MQRHNCVLSIYFQTGKLYISHMILELGHEHETLVDFYGVVIVFVGACAHTHAHVVMQLASYCS
jgi:hypothetical protein